MTGAHWNDCKSEPIHLSDQIDNEKVEQFRELAGSNPALFPNNYLLKTKNHESNNRKFGCTSGR